MNAPQVPIPRPLLYLVISMGLTAHLPAQFIINSSISAQPGDAISLQGNFAATATVQMTTNANPSLVALPIQVQSAGHAIVRIPGSAALDVYKICAQNAGASSPGPFVYVNRAWGMHFDSPEVTPGGSLRIFGRNLTLGSGVARVRLVPQNAGGGGGEATIDFKKSDAYKLQLTLPNALTPGVNYDVFVTNGLGGVEGETKMAAPVLAIAAGADYFALGVPWAAKLNFFNNVYNVKTDSRLSLKAIGDGVANDLAALQGAIDRANQDGGGIVFLPTGTFRCELPAGATGGLIMRSRVVVQGAGRDLTAVNFGYGMNAPGWVANGHWGMIWDNTQQAGLADLSMNNVDNTGVFTNNVTGKGTEIFLQRIRFNLNKGDWLWLADSNKLAITDSQFIQGVNSQAGYHGPVQMGGCRNFVIARNFFNFAMYGLNLPRAQDGVIEDNTIHRDGAARWPVALNLVNHVLILDFAENVAVLKNVFKVINGPSQNINDGETIIAEGGGPDRVDVDSGTVTGATALTLQDNAKSWGGFRMKPIVAIVYGAGRGQWRRITSRSGSTLNIDRPWDVMPVAGSRYTIFNWGARNWLVQGNYLEGNQRGITIYHNATHQMALVGNTLKNSGSIDLTPLQSRDSDSAPMNFVPMYDNQIIGNSVSDEDGAMGVFIGAHTVQHVVGNTFGTSVIGLELRNNSVTAHIPNTPAVVDGVFPNGYLNYLEWHPGSFVDEGIPALLGTILEDNVAINCNKALYVSTATHDTLVANLAVVNTPQLIQDTRYENALTASLRTTVQGALPTTYATWRALRFSSADQANPAVSGQRADPEKDGLTNLVEYFFDTDPLAFTPQPWSVESKTPSDGLTLTYSHNTAKTDVSVSPKTSTDLQNWSASGVTQTALTPGMVQTREARIPLDQPKLFLRLELVGP